jgi:hypothetical protein
VTAAAESEHDFMPQAVRSRLNKGDAAQPFEKQEKKRCQTAGAETASGATAPLSASSQQWSS